MIKLLPLLLLLGQSTPEGAATPEPVAPESSVDVVENLNQRVPLGLHFTDEAGKDVQLGSLMKGRPVILAFVYYRCPVLCNLLLSGLASSLQKLDWKLGKEYDVITVSLDPSETPQMASEKRNGYLNTLGMTGSNAWHFLTGHVDDIDALAEASGFRYLYIAKQRQFAHAAALFMLTPDGRLSRYLYGVEFNPKQVKAALFEASGGRVGTSFERVLLRCYRYDAKSKRYELFITRYIRAGGALTMLLVGSMLSLFWRRELKMRDMKMKGGRA